MSQSGTFRTCRDSGHLVALAGKPDLSLAAAQDPPDRAPRSRRDVYPVQHDAPLRSGRRRGGVMKNWITDVDLDDPLPDVSDFGEWDAGLDIDPISHV